MRLRLLAFVILIPTSLVGCSGEDAAKEAPQAAPAVDRGPAPSAERDPVGSALHQQIVNHAGDYEEVGEAVTGRLDEGQSHTHPFVVIGTWCYRVFAQGGAGVEDLSLELIDSNGVPVQRDSEDGPSASLGLVDSICPYSAGRFTLLVRATRGGGDYAFRVFRKQVL